MSDIYRAEWKKGDKQYDMMADFYLLVRNFYNARDTVEYAEDFMNAIEELSNKYKDSTLDEIMVAYFTERWDFIKKNRVTEHTKIGNYDIMIKKRGGESV